MRGVGSFFQKKSNHDVNMTEGSIFRHILTFAFPLLLGNVFQQLYNMVDTMIVGKLLSGISAVLLAALLFHKRKAPQAV